MCSACSKGKKTSFQSTSNPNCKNLRKRLISIKKKAYARYKIEKDESDYSVYRQITLSLSNYSFCPELYVVEAYETEYGN